MSPALTVRPLVMLMSLPLAATAQWITTVPALVCKVAKATADALPVAFVSDVIEFAVAVPLDDAPNAVALRGSVATAVPGDATDDGLIRNTRLPLLPINAVTASVAALRAAVLCVTAKIFPLNVCPSVANQHFMNSSSANAKQFSNLLKAGANVI